MSLLDRIRARIVGRRDPPVGQPPPCDTAEWETLLAARQLDLLADRLWLCIDAQPAEVLVVCERARAGAPTHDGLRRVFARALQHAGRTDEYLVLENDVRQQGFQVVHAGDLQKTVQYYEFFQPAFPDMCSAYLSLYRTMLQLTTRYRASQRPASRPGALVISITVWGGRYLELLTRYFLPSILSEHNIPAVARRRSIVFDFYVIDAERATLESSAAFRKLASYGQVNFVSFPTSILQSEEYRKYPAMRYYIYGGFHHVSIEHARARHADIICIAPDGVQSDGAFSRFVELIDEGYEAVLFTSIRAQAEAVLPLLDRFRSEDGTTLAIPAAELVLMSTQHIHHDFLRHFLFRGNRRIPGFQSILFFLNPRGFIVRCFHIHPIIMSFEAISRDIVFDYATVDGNTLLRIFPDPARFESLKIIQDTREGLMMDLAYTYEEYPTPEIEFEQRNLLRHTNLLGPNHYWHFLHPVEYRCERAIAHIGSYERQADGSLKRLEIPISSGLPVADTDIETFLRTHLTEEFAAVNIPR